MKVFKQTTRIVLFSLLALILTFPFIYMLLQSFMDPRESISIPVKLVPTIWTFSNYITAVDLAFLKSLGNTMYILVFNMIAVPLTGYIVAYGFAKIKFQGSALIFSIGMSTIMVPGIVMTVPRYVMFADFGWINTLHPFTIPNLFGGGMMNIFLIYQFLRGIPNTYIDAAKVDGASELKICLNIIMPLVKPVLTLIMVQTFIGIWNDFTGPLTYISQDQSHKWTLGVMVYYRFRLAVLDIDKAPSLQSAVCVIMMIPTVTLFGFFQKTLINGVAFTGLKG